MAQKTFVAMVLVALLVLGQAQEKMVLAKLCKPKCLIKCAWAITLGSVAYASCVAICMLDCKSAPSDAVMGCTSDCAKNALQNHRPDATTMESFVDRCYDSCKQKK